MTVAISLLSLARPKNSNLGGTELAATRALDLAREDRQMLGQLLEQRVPARIGCQITDQLTSSACDRG